MQAATVPGSAAHRRRCTQDIEQALNVLESAERPLVIVGKGMAWSRAEDEVRAFIERTQLPFLASPMGKGVMDDNHPLSVGAARSHALQEADVIFLMGARFNWIMHFGLPPRFNKNVRIDPARHLAGGDQPEHAGRGRAGRRRQGDRRATQQGAGEPPVVLPEGYAVACGDRQEVGREREADRSR